MINTMTPGTKQGHDDARGEVLERINREYGKPEEKAREAVKKLGKDEFFKLMINQVQHQDPLKPYQNEQMAAQMAQFTSLEQMVNMNENLNKLINAQQPLQNLGAANLIGKYVTSDSARIVHTEGKYSPLAFDLPADAKKVHITIVSEKGENVREIEKTNVKGGPFSIDWDGKKENNMLAPSGNYTMQISAFNDKDQAFQVKTQNTQVVHGIGFEGKETVLYTGDITKPTKMLLKNVSKIIDTSQNGKPAQAQNPLAALQALLGPQGAEGGEGGQPPMPPEERNVEDAVVGQSAKYTPYTTDVIKKMNEKPETISQRPPTAEEVRAARERPDLSAANLAAQDVAAGKPLSGGPAPEIGDVNPAAMQRGYKPSAGKAVPSGVEGSVVGKLTE